MRTESKAYRRQNALAITISGNVDAKKIFPCCKFQVSFNLLSPLDPFSGCVPFKLVKTNCKQVLIISFIKTNLTFSLIFAYILFAIFKFYTRTASLLSHNVLQMLIQNSRSTGNLFRIQFQNYLEM